MSHCIVIQKLEVIGDRGKLLSLLASYLTKRKQRVYVGKNTSAPAEIISGVPQESLLGLLVDEQNPEYERMVSIEKRLEEYRTHTAQRNNLDIWNDHAVKRKTHRFRNITQVNYFKFHDVLLLLAVDNGKQDLKINNCIQVWAGSTRQNI